MRSINTAGLELIKRFEGFVPKVYLCPAGIPTIGYGHVVKKGEDFTGGITHDKASMILAQDVFFAEDAVCRLITVPLNDNQFSALVSFTFNVGSGALQRSTLRMKLNRGEYEEVPKELLRWSRAGGRVLKGLLARRRAEAALFEATVEEEPLPTDESAPRAQKFSAITDIFRKLFS